MRKLRRLHLLAGCFAAPLTLFLAVTGAWQALRYHKSLKDGTYSAPAALKVLSSVHTNEFERADRGIPSEDCSKVASSEELHECERRRADALKARQNSRRSFGAVLIFAAACLSLNALSGVWMALSLPKGRRPALALIALGIVVPIALLFLA